MSGIDHLLQRLRKLREEGGRPGGGEAVSARFLVTKLSWRGNYRRLLCITPTHITTVRWLPPRLPHTGRPRRLIASACHWRPLLEHPPPSDK